MNLFWTAGLAVFVLLEKTIPVGHWIGYVVGIALIVWGVVVLTGVIRLPVIVNGRIISQEVFEDTLSGRAAGFDQISAREVSRGEFSGTLHVSINAQSRVLVRFTDISLSGSLINGEAFLVQQGGPTHGFRNLFGLAPIPVSGHYGLGGFVNLDILHPTAGREALSRESIQHVANLVELIEAEASADIAGTTAADGNQQFQQYILSHGLIALAEKVKISTLPAQEMVALGDVQTYEPDKTKHFYVGQDATILKRFASDQANLIHVSQANPRRKLQLQFLTQITKLEQVPEHTIVDRIPATQLTFEEPSPAASAQCRVPFRTEEGSAS